MKKTITILAILISISAYSQSLIDFVNDNIGKKVGTGYCDELVRQYNPTWYHYNMNRILKHSEKPKKAKVGDLVTFNHVEMYSGFNAINHIAVVYKVIGDGVFMIAHQNGADKLKDSKVFISKLDINDLKSGTILFHKL